MIALNCQSKRFSIILTLTLVVWTVTGYGAPLVEREGLAFNHTPLVALGSCKDVDMSSYSNKNGSWQKNCRLALLTNERSISSLSSFHYDLVWGDRFNHSQLTVDESVQCFAESKFMVLNTRKNCILMGAPWLHDVTDIPTTAHTFQSLFEFELSDSGRRRLESNEVISSYRSQGHSVYSRARVLDELGFANFTSMNTTMRLLGDNAEEFRNIMFTDNNYKIEASDTITRFIPISTRPIRRLEFGDMISILLLVLLLPDYRRLGGFLGSVFVRRSLKC